MLSKKHTIKKKKDFNSAFKQGYNFANNLFILKVGKSSLDFSRFAFVAPSKIIKGAVDRNKTKRIMRACIKDNDYAIKEGLDIIIIAKENLKYKKHKEIKNNIMELFKKSKIIKEK